MRRRRTFSSLVAFGLVLAACSGASPSPSTSASATAGPSFGPFVALSYPPTGLADCAYGGEFKQIKAVDELTVEFDLCNPDPAFLPKLALANNEIQDSDYLAANMANHLILARPNGTGPYKFGEYVRGDHITLVRNDSYWGEKAKAAQVIFQWNSESAARLLALQAGTVDGIDNPGPDDFATISADSSLVLKPREATNVMYVGMTNTFKPFDNLKVRQALAQGIDRQRIIDNFYPVGSSVADFFTPCSITNGCEGNKWYAFDVAAAKTLLDQGLAEEGMPTGGFATKLYYRDVVRGYLPDPNVVAQDIQAQLKANLNIDITIEVQASGTFLDNSSAGLLDGLYLLGWGADYPDVTNFLDYHFNNVGNKQFGAMPASITDPLKIDGSTADLAARKAAVTKANNAIRDFVPMIPIAHGGSATAWKADVTGAHSSPLTNEDLSVMDPGGRDTLVFMQNAYPISLYCGDETDGETIRVCFQIGETLYTWETGTANVVPGLADSCDTNADLTVWTCHLHPGVTFHNGARLDANDVMTTFAVQWDVNHPLHIGRTASFEYWAGMYGPYLNTPPS